MVAGGRNRLEEEERGFVPRVVTSTAFHGATVKLQSESSVRFRDANLTYDVFGGAGLATIAQIANTARIGSTASWGAPGPPVHLAGGHLPQGTPSWGAPGPGAAALARSSAAK